MPANAATPFGNPECCAIAAQYRLARPHALPARRQPRQSHSGHAGSPPGPAPPRRTGRSPRTTGRPPRRSVGPPQSGHGTGAFVVLLAGPSRSPPVSCRTPARTRGPRTASGCRRGSPAPAPRPCAPRPHVPRRDSPPQPPPHLVPSLCITKAPCARKSLFHRRRASGVASTSSRCSTRTTRPSANSVFAPPPWRGLGHSPSSVSAGSIARVPIPVGLSAMAIMSDGCTTRDSRTRRAPGDRPTRRDPGAGRRTHARPESLYP